jgi:hypothetical protein
VATCRINRNEDPTLVDTNGERKMLPSSFEVTCARGDRPTTPPGKATYFQAVNRKKTASR